MAEKPLMLKDYLELESSSESFRWASLQRIGPAGGRGITVRRLLETEFGIGTSDNSGWTLVRFRSKRVLTKLSNVIKILQFSTNELSPSAAGGGGGGGSGGNPSRILSRSFSKKLKRSFWKKRGLEKRGGKVMEKEELECGHLFYSSPGFSKCSSSSDLFACGRRKTTPKIPKSGLSPSLIPSPQNVIFIDGGGGGSGDSGDNGREQKKLSGKDMDCPSEEEKEQLSPVSVMDFPYPDEEEDEEVEQLSSTSPPCFEKSIASIERTKNQLLQRIRRLESLADLALDLDLDQPFTCSEAHAESTVHVATKDERWRHTAYSLLRRLDCGESLSACGEKLLFDFFVEGLSLNEECQQGMTSGRHGDEELLREADGWFTGGKVTAEREWEMGFREMERGSVGWRRFEEEEEVVAAGISCGLLTRLMAEVVDDLVSAA